VRKPNSCSPYVGTGRKVKVSDLLDTNEIKATTPPRPSHSNFACYCVRQFSYSPKTRVRVEQEPEVTEMIICNVFSSVTWSSCYYIHNSLEQGLSSKVDSYSAGQETPCSTAPEISLPCRQNPATGLYQQTIQSSRQLSYNPWGIQTKVVFISHMSDTYHLLDLMVLITVDEEHKL
jgi:hypothetical protein